MFQEKTEAVVRQEREDRRTESGVMLVKVDTSHEWRPKGAMTKPPMRATGLPLDLASELVIRLNRQSIEEDRRRWAVVVGQGNWYGVLTFPLAVTEERPDDPAAWPPTMKMVDLTPGEAGIRCRDLNRSIRETAFIPRIWGVVVRRPVVDLVPSEV